MALPLWPTLCKFQLPWDFLMFTICMQELVICPYLRFGIWSHYIRKCDIIWWPTFLVKVSSLLLGFEPGNFGASGRHHILVAPLLINLLTYHSWWSGTAELIKNVYRDVENGYGFYRSLDIMYCKPLNKWERHSAVNMRKWRTDKCPLKVFFKKPAQRFIYKSIVYVLIQPF